MVNVWAQSPGTTKFSPHDQRLGAGSPGSATFGRRVNGVVRSRRRGVPASDPCSGLRGVPATAPPFVHPAADRSTAWSTFGRTVQASAKFHRMINLRAHSPAVHQVPPHDQPSGAQSSRPPSSTPWSTFRRTVQPSTKFLQHGQPSGAQGTGAALTPAQRPHPQPHRGPPVDHR